MLDIMGLCIAVGFYLYRPTLTLAVLPFAVGVQYTASCLYHWLPNRKHWWAFDHLAIAFLITATYVQFWIGGLPSDASHWRIFFLFAMMLNVWLITVAEPNNGLLRGVLYAVLTFIGLVLSLLHPGMLPFEGWVVFIAGIALYGIQQLILAVESPNPMPEVFGYREVQHCILVAASTTHLFVAAKYLAP